jgi:phosphoenolpyruvate carboxylase
MSDPQPPRPAAREPRPGGTPLTLDPELREDVRLLGQLLGRVIEHDRGPAFVECIETIRALAKRARSGGADDWRALREYLERIPGAETLAVARAFNQFLNLANIAEQHHQIRQQRSVGLPLSLPDHPDLTRQLAQLTIELVLTAHPTEILRRTLIQKYDAISATLNRLDDCIPAERKAYLTELERLIGEAWHTDEIRHERPAPQEEAKWGFAVIEHSLWHALPRTLRALDAALAADGHEPLPISSAPIRFAIWMGGDRDGNPNVTANVTREVLMLARWMAADLLLRDIDELIATLSMHRCSAALRQAVGDVHEPYRALLKSLRNRLRHTRDWAERLDPRPPDLDICYTDDAVSAPLQLCYDSLRECGMESIAAGPLKDTLRRVHCFGVHLVRLDIRQSADRHEQVFDELTRYLEIRLGERSYAAWTEHERQEFLVSELANRRPLFPSAWPASPEVQEVLATMRVIGEQQGAGIAEYIISMASRPSDVLAVILLLRDGGLQRPIPIVPLFETLADLDGAADCIDALLGIAWYRAYCGGGQQVMIGYSDSAKDAGQLAAAWAQYRAQERLAEVCARHGVKLALFHGRGGAVGRGGGPAQAAIRSQPPGSVAGTLRVTEQGEMIRFKLGQAELATDTLARYVSSTLEATLTPPPHPTAAWRAQMDAMAAEAHRAYRGVVADDPEFVHLFRNLTPEQELGILALGSRPARRRASADVGSLRAIPWVFAWTQVRLMLPAWLGTDAALAHVRRQDVVDDVRAMLAWPFFRMQMDMLEMVLAKADRVLVGYYADRLATPAQRESVGALCGRQAQLERDLLALRGTDYLLQADPALADALRVRDTYLDPLHLLQAELLARYRGSNREPSEHTRPPADDAIVQALKVTMAGIATGLRNTG